MSGDSLQSSDITEIILDTANSICSTMLESIDESIYPLLDKVIFINKNILTDSYFPKIFGNSPTTGILILSNCLLFAFILYYCIRIITSKFSGTEIEYPHQFFLRAILSAITMNASLEICSILIDGTSQISTFFCNLGKSLFNVEISFESIISNLNSPSSNKFNIFSLDGILTSTLSISSLGLLVSFAFRYIIIKLLVLAAPFAFLCISNKTTEGFLRSWYRTLLSMLLIQIVVSVLLILIYSILQDKSNPFLNKILLVGSISALLKSGQLVKEFLGGIGITANFQSGIAGIKSMFAR